MKEHQKNDGTFFMSGQACDICFVQLSQYFQ